MPALKHGSTSHYNNDYNMQNNKSSIINETLQNRHPGLIYLLQLWDCIIQALISELGVLLLLNTVNP